MARTKKSLRVADLSDDEEFQSLVREAAEGRDTTILRNAAANKEKGVSTIWKVLGLILVGIIVMVFTDSMEIKHANSGDIGGDMDMDGIPGASIVTKKQKPKTPTLPAENHPAATTGGAESLAVQEVAGNEVTTQVDTPATSETPAATANTEESPPASKIEVPVVAVPVVELPVVAEDVGEDTDRHTYTPRGQPTSDADRQAMISKWGSWTLVDDKPRPTGDYFKKYPNRDIPRSQFPSNAWQIDQDYLAKFLQEGIALAQRAQEGILAEYGHSEGTWEERSTMFHMDMHEGTLDSVQFPKDFQGDKGGWTTKKSWEGLKRRIFHAVMTEDWFVFAMGGHSAAAGHG
jgi:hypothetical protein